jgi:hypothetical protein
MGSDILNSETNLSAQVGFVNAVLRAYDRESNMTRKTLIELERTQPHVALSHPSWLVATWQVGNCGASSSKKMGKALFLLLGMLEC